MEELNNQRKERGENNFYSVMDQYYGRTEADEKHSSPVKRLIQHKNTTVEHKQVIQRQLTKGEKAQTYVTGPGKSYVIEAQGEINYNLAQKDPLKFYDKLFNQPIV